jgi:excisionase family DNA binding protein
MLTVDDLKTLPDFLSIEQFAEILEVSPRTIERRIAAGKLDYLKEGSWTRIPKVECLRLLGLGYRSRSLL